MSPAPDGIADADFGVEGATYVAEAGLIILPSDVVRASDDPRATVVRLADGGYDAAIELRGWPTNLTGPRHDGWYASGHRVFAS